MSKSDRWHHCNDEKVSLEETERLIERAMKDFKIVDLVTEASSMIIALIRTLKRQCLQLLLQKHFLLMLLSVLIFR